jgi:hypothetical protein
MFLYKIKNGIKQICLISRPTAGDGVRLNDLKRISGSAHLVHKALFERPTASPNWIQEKKHSLPLQQSMPACGSWRN